jgi:hypothetical protein
MKKKTKKSPRRKSYSGSKKASMSGILLDGAVTIASVLGTQALAKMLVGKDKTLVEAGFMPLIPSALGVASPFVLKSNLSRPLAIGSLISLAMSAIAIMDAKNVASGKKDPSKQTLFESVFLTGNDPMLDPDVFDIDDLTPEQKLMLGEYVMTGSNTDPLSGKNDTYVMTGDNTDPLS